MDTIDPKPTTPAQIRIASETAHNRQSQNTCARSKPCRNTNAFCAPMASISENAEIKPVVAAVIMNRYLAATALMGLVGSFAFG